MSTFKKGDLIKFNITNMQYTEDGFATGDVLNCKNNEIRIKEIIDLDNFPSWNDFKGSSTLIKHGDTGIILSLRGKPSKLSISEMYDIPLPGGKIYNVYEVLVSDNQKRQVFEFNIELII